jgi:hypothetical protein
MNRFAPSLAVLAATALAAPHAGAQADAAPPAHGTARLAGASTKVTAPVEVVITALPEPGPGRRRVRITARPSVDAASLSLEVSAESGLALADPAPTAWTGPARAGEETVREVDLAVSGPGELRLIVTATLKHGGDVVQTGVHEFAFNPAAPADAALTKGLGRGRAPATDPGGRTIVEVPARRP